MVNPKYTKTQFMARHPSGLAVLPALPHAVAVHVLRLTGNLKADDGTMVLIADELSTQETLARSFPGREVVLTGTGVHVNQLFPDEFAGTIAAEVDLLAEARKRPRPNALFNIGDDEDDIVGNQCRGRTQEEEDQDSDGQSEYDTIMEQPYSEERGLQYRPHVQVQDGDVLEIAHRLQGWTDSRGLCRNELRVAP